jgi:hypothetical protein
MQIQITINCDSAAFKPYPEPELSAILRRCVEQSTYNQRYADGSVRVSLGNIWTGMDSSLVDSQGNTVGRMTCDDDTEEEDAKRLLADKGGASS